MPLTPGTRLGPYEITAQIGVGGMGEVYRATDTNLGREVAIKVLPDAFAQDAERLARFEREAKTLASLSHPNIAIIHGLEKTERVRALVMELVEGPTLADRIAQGPVAIDEALPIARQIAEALEAAHEQGIIHRDLKPANVKVRDDGTVKVLDFGLAKMLEGPAEAGHYVRSAATMSPTITTPAMTQMGMILGTAAYMSPEQARGKPVDKRSDIWAFGCVLFEMLSGRRAFEGDDTTDTIAAVVRLEPRWDALPDDLPAAIRLLLKRCLEKDRKKRLGDISGAIFVLNEPTLAASAADATSAARASSRWKRAIPLVAVIATAIVVGAATWMLRPSPSPPSVTRFAIRLPDGQQFTNVGRPLVAISPDGTRMVYVANQRLYLRSMSENAAREIPGSFEQQGITTPTFSPDGQSIAFVSTRDRMFKRISVEGGAAVKIAQMQSSSLGLSWTDDGLVFGERSRGIVRVSPNGGTPEVLLAPTNEEYPYGAQLLPGGEAMLVTLGKPPSPGEAVRDPNPDFLIDTHIVVVSLKTGARRTIVEHGSDARYIPTGHIVYAEGDALLAVRFDLGRQQVIGDSFPVVQGVRRSTATPAAQYNVSRSGTLVYLPGSVSERQSLTVIDRQGRTEILKASPAAYSVPRVSPDGKRIAVAVEESNSKATHIWIYELTGGASIRQLTVEGQQNRFPVWSSDGERVAFLSDRGGDLAIWWQRADGMGSAERLTQPGKGESHAPLSWHPREQTLLFVVSKTDVRAGASLWTYSVADKHARPFAGVTSAQNLSAQFSPDGRWVVYHAVADAAPGAAFGRQSIFVRPYPSTDATVYPVASGGHPAWAPDGSELFFQRAGGGTFFVTRVTMRPAFAISEPQGLPSSVGGQTFWRNYDVTPDGKLVAVVNAPDSEDSGPQINVVLNWFEELKRLVPAK